MNSLNKKYHTKEKSSGKPGGIFFQPKLTINQPGDSYEQEADAVADQVMRMGTPSIQKKSLDHLFFKPVSITPVQRKCSECEEEEKMQRKEMNSADVEIENFVGGLNSAGQSIPASLRNFYEPRFGYDFSNVKIHTGGDAAKSARSINALAYTSGNNIVFNHGQYSPSNDNGKRLLAHELTHVLQQNNTSTQNNVQRFADNDHHVVEEVALNKVFSEEELKKIEQGNMQRDYSQLPRIGISLLTGIDSDFGGYKTHEHFDHFIFDTEKNRWVSHDEYEKIWDDSTKQWIKRPMPQRGAGTAKINPMQYIEGELQAAVEKDVPDASAFIHLGNAFHTIEDFFAHSNFVELTKGDYSSGTELTTHPPGVPGTSSVDSILGNVLDPVPASIYKDRFKADFDKASPVSHGRMAKDFHQHPNHSLAMTLAALVIRQIGIMMKHAFSIANKKLRNEYVQDPVMKILSGYFRPPTDKDKWWETMLGEDNGITARRIKELQDKTPVTVNQSPASPLRNLEATKFSTFKAIGLGTSVSVPLKDNTFFTAGYMLYVPGSGTTPDNKILVAPRSDWDQHDTPKIILGAQISGSFDLNDLFGK